MKLTKKRKKALENLDALKYYNVEDACDIVKKAANSNFDAVSYTHLTLPTT